MILSYNAPCLVKQLLISVLRGGMYAMLSLQQHFQKLWVPMIPSVCVCVIRGGQFSPRNKDPMQTQKTKEPSAWLYELYYTTRQIPGHNSKRLYR